ncbi:hypothetical protein COT72_01535 [archaeon CG10_big_fil_rev_8_21_14_0_10_43_11]|nr:MAG: hypothetical protein COT72_01535 [archaeon CG10_big_fil_rev_8_21_14_0_10_43_11]
MKIIGYHENDVYKAYLLESVKLRSPEKVALPLHSISEFHAGLHASDSRIRMSAKHFVDIVKYCRDNDIELVFYGLRNEQRVRVLSKESEKKGRVYRVLDRFVKRVSAYDKRVAHPEWTQKSFRGRVGTHVLGMTENRFLSGVRALANTVMANKLRELNGEDVLVFVSFSDFGPIKKNLKRTVKL